MSLLRGRAHVCHAHARPPEKRLRSVPNLLSRDRIFRAGSGELETFDDDLQIGGCQRSVAFKARRVESGSMRSYAVGLVTGED